MEDMEEMESKGEYYGGSWNSFCWDSALLFSFSLDRDIDMEEEEEEKILQEVTSLFWELGREGEWGGGRKWESSDSIAMALYTYWDIFKL